MNFPTIETPRLILKILDTSAIKHVIETYSREDMWAFFGIANEQQEEEEMKRYRAGYDSYNRSVKRFIIIEKTSQKVIGACAFHNWFISHNRSEIGYNMLSDEVKQKGYMTETVSAVIDYGFNTMNLHRIEATTGRENIASQKILLKHGFVFEGVLREHYNVNGIHQDSLSYSLLRNEFVNTLK